jgi:ABC-type multidrug transport system ATPase subunit
MSLLAIERVSKRVGSGARARIVLRDISLELDPAEYAVVWGLRGSGRSTLLRLAAGVQAPDSGSVRFEGRVLKGSGDELGQGIGYCHNHFGAGEGRNPLDVVMMGLLARGIGAADARVAATAALERCELSERARVPLGDLDAEERIRLSLARSLALSPRLLIVDEPTSGVELLQRDGILALLRTLSDSGIAVLASTGEPAGLSGADRTLALGDGGLRGQLEPQLAEVVPLRDSARRAAAG